MYNPKDILTEDGFKRLERHVGNIEEGLFFIMNHASDLHIGCLDEKQIEALHEVYRMTSGFQPLLLTGDGETDDE